MTTPTPPAPGTAQPGTSGAAVTSLIFGILSVLGGCLLCAIPPIVAIITGHVGFSQTRAGRRSGRGLAITGLILGYALLLPGLFLAFFVAFRPDSAAEILKSLIGSA